MKISLGSKQDFDTIKAFNSPRIGSRRGLARDSVPTEAKFLTVRTDDGFLMGAALVGISGNCLSVSHLHCRQFPEGLGAALAQGLRALAAEHGTATIWLETEFSPEMRAVFEAGGFRVKAFYSVNPADSESPRIAFWSLPPENISEVASIYPPLHDRIA